VTHSDKEAETTTFLVLIVYEMSASIGYHEYDMCMYHIRSVLIDVVSIHIKALTTRRYLRMFEMYGLA
jgi:hypothetical protein